MNPFFALDPELVQSLRSGDGLPIPVRLERLLESQGRTLEAQRYADLLKRSQDEDPYHWLGLGVAALNEGRNGAAISALGRAASLTSGFEEVHYHLGLAYWRDGQREQTGKQLAALEAINSVTLVLRY